MDHLKLVDIMGIDDCFLSEISWSSGKYDDRPMNVYAYQETVDTRRSVAATLAHVRVIPWRA